MSTPSAPFESNSDAVTLANAASGREAQRYLVASIAALSLDAGLLWCGVRSLSLPAWLAGSLSYGAGLILIYVLSVRWVFSRRTAPSARAEFVVFAALGLVGLLCNAITLLVATSVGLPLLVAKALAAGIGFIANFVSRKVLLFAPTP